MTPPVSMRSPALANLPFFVLKPDSAARMSRMTCSALSSFTRDCTAFARLVTGQGLRKRRLLLGLTQRELAERLGMARNTITRYERGLLPVIPKYVELATDALLARLPKPKQR